MRLCYRLSPENVPFEIRISYGIDSGPFSQVFRQNDNGAGGGDCNIYLDLATNASPGTRTVLGRAFINGTEIARATTNATILSNVITQIAVCPPYCGNASQRSTNASVWTDQPSYPVGGSGSFCWTVSQPGWIRITDTDPSGKAVIVVDRNVDGDGCQLVSFSPPVGTDTLNLSLYAGSTVIATAQWTYQITQGGNQGNQVPFFCIGVNITTCNGQPIPQPPAVSGDAQMAALIRETFALGLQLAGAGLSYAGCMAGDPIACGSLAALVISQNINPVSGVPEIEAALKTGDGVQCVLDLVHKRPPLSCFLVAGNALQYLLTESDINNIVSEGRLTPERGVQLKQKIR